jgi:hypothetical protein
MNGLPDGMDLPGLLQTVIQPNLSLIWGGAGAALGALVVAALMSSWERMTVKIATAGGQRRRL